MKTEILPHFLRSEEVFHTQTGDSSQTIERFLVCFLIHVCSTAGIPMYNRCLARERGFFTAQEGEGIPPRSGMLVLQNQTPVLWCHLHCPIQMFLHLSLEPTLSMEVPLPQCSSFSVFQWNLLTPRIIPKLIVPILKDELGNEISTQKGNSSSRSDKHQILLLGLSWSQRLVPRFKLATRCGPVLKEVAMPGM